MKITELKINNTNAYLYEGLTPKNKSSMMLWESAGRAIAEAQLTVPQITQLFQQIEKSATEAGGNRSALGLGKDALVAVNNAYKDLVSKVQNSGPMKNADAAYEQAAAKLRQATGGDAGVMQYVDKYRTFAKAHPVAQSLIYGALIAAAGISGAGAGGATALGLFKMTDKLLQGEKFSAAAVAGAETGALAYGASQLGKAIRGADQTSNIPTDNDPTAYSDSYEGYMIANQPVIPGQPLSQDQLSVMKMAMDMGNRYPPEVMAQYASQVGGANESRNLTSKQVLALFEHIVIAEGLFDKFKSGAVKVAGAVGGAAKKGAQATAQAVGQKAQQVGHNLTTKITVDKLQAAWKKAGSPTDSGPIAKIVQSLGVAADVVTNSLKAIGVKPEPKVNPAQGQAPTDQPADVSGLPDISRLTRKQKEQLLAIIDQLDQGQGQPNGYNTQTGQTYASQAEREAGEAENDKTVAAQDARYQAWKEKHSPKQRPTSAEEPANEEPITVGGQKINPNDPKYASLMRQLQQAKAQA